MTVLRDGHARLERLLTTRGALPALFVVFLLPRVLILLLDVTQTSDGGWYLSRALGLARGEGYSEGGIPTAFWPPGWPLTMSVLFRIFGPEPLVAKGFNLLCSAATAWFTLDLGRRIFRSESAARLGLLLLAIYPNSIGFVPLLFTETYFTTLLLAGCWTTLAWRGAARIVATGAILGVATLVKAQAIVLIPMLFALVLLHDGITGRRLVTTALQAAATLVVAGAVVFPWSLRNHAVFGEWVVVSTNGGHTLLTGNNPSARGDYTPEDPSVTEIPFSVAIQVEADREAKRRAVEWIKAHPGSFVGLMPLKVFRLWAPDGESEWFYQRGYAPYERHVVLFRAVRIVNQAYYALIMIGFAVALVRLASSRARRATTMPGWRWLPYLVALFPTMIAIVFSGQSRFHFPVMPLVMMVVGWLAMVDVGRSKVVEGPIA